MVRYCPVPILVLVAAPAFSGCVSSTSYFMHRFDSDAMTANANGRLGVHHDAKPFKGIPVTLKVPTHVDISIRETILMDRTTLEAVPTVRRNLKASSEPVYSDKIFSVDPIRAAAGSTNYTITMRDQGADPRDKQYFKSITKKIQDETIKDTNAALNKILPLLTPKASAALEIYGDGPSADDDLISYERHVAWKRFDINSPDFEHQVQLFVEHHLNACNSCCTAASHEENIESDIIAQ
jgi:hypothetical protein